MSYMDLTVDSAHNTICKPRMRKSCANSQPSLQTGHYSSTATVSVWKCFLRNVPRCEDAASSIWLTLCACRTAAFCLPLQYFLNLFSPLFDRFNYKTRNSFHFDSTVSAGSGETAL